MGFLYLKMQALSQHDFYFVLQVVQMPRIYDNRFIT